MSWWPTERDRLRYTCTPGKPVHCIPLVTSEFIFKVVVLLHTHSHTHNQDCTVCSGRTDWDAGREVSEESE